MKRHIFLFILGSLFFVSSAYAGVLKLTPPTSLCLDDPTCVNPPGNIDSGIFTLKEFSGLGLDLSETEILGSTSADDITHAATIGSGIGADILTYPGTFPIIQFVYTFDATTPDLPPITSNVLSASTNFTISLPFLSSTSGFFEVIDFTGLASFNTMAPVLDTMASGITNIDLFGDGTVFATFGSGNVVLAPVLFQDHGTVIVVPIPATIWLFSIGLLGIFNVSKKIRINA